MKKYIYVLTNTRIYFNVYAAARSKLAIKVLIITFNTFVTQRKKLNKKYEKEKKSVVVVKHSGVAGRQTGTASLTIRESSGENTTKQTLHTSIMPEGFYYFFPTAFVLVVDNKFKIFVRKVVWAKKSINDTKQRFGYNIYITREILSPFKRPKTSKTKFQKLSLYYFRHSNFEKLKLFENSGILRKNFLQLYITIN